MLSMAEIDEDERDHDGAPADGDATSSSRRVTTAPGRAIGYQRCWSQRSADHRGTPQFNGIVCTLLSDDEVWRLRNNKSEPLDNGGTRRPSMTEGLIYTVDVDLVEDCLAELDFREKGGYARDVIDVVEDDTGNTVKALLYRGTPENPAFWKRVLLDVPLAAAIMSVAIGPSGPNDLYLLHLHSFLTHASQHSASAALALDDHSGDVRTGELARMVKLLRSEHRPYFLFGAGSNEHDQLLLSGSSGSDSALGDTNEVSELTEMLLVVPRHGSDREIDNAAEGPSSIDGNANHDPQSLHAGGGHSALLTCGGDLYLWGWNDAGQLGRESPTSKSDRKTTASFPLNAVPPLSNIKVAAVDLGHTHTLVIEKGTGRLFGFGENGRGQVSGSANSECDATNETPYHVPQTPIGSADDHFVDVAAGLFHSAAITKQGELLTWGCARFGQSLTPTNVDTRHHDGSAAPKLGRWRPADGSKLVQVSCGRRHTVALDEHGRVWTMGDNKYGQLGRSVDATVSKNAEPQLVEGMLGRANSGCSAICSGWSHILVLSRDEDSGESTLYGWGRNDKGQLGTQSMHHVPVPQILKPTVDACKISVSSACCGAESSHVLDANGKLCSTGWNEHGNLATGIDSGVAGSDCCPSWAVAAGVRVVAPPHSRAERALLAAGGAHVITMVT